MKNVTQKDVTQKDVTRKNAKKNAMKKNETLGQFLVKVLNRRKVQQRRI